MNASRNKSEDQELIKRAKSGDRRAFKMLVERYQKSRTGIAYGMLRNRDALDASQEAFVRVYRNPSRSKETAHFILGSTTLLLMFASTTVVNMERFASLNMTRLIVAEMRQK